MTVDQAIQELVAFRNDYPGSGDWNLISTDSPAGLSRKVEFNRVNYSDLGNVCDVTWCYMDPS